MDQRSRKHWGRKEGARPQMSAVSRSLLALLACAVTHGIHSRCDFPRRL